MKKQSVFFDPETSFFKLPIVWYVVFVIGLAAWTVTDEILTHGDYQYIGTAEAFNTMASDFKVPLGILSLLIPIVAVMTAHHRSEMTLKQIRESQAQNNFSNYYKHIEEFEKTYQALISKYFDDTFENLHPRAAYKTFFPNNSSLFFVLQVNYSSFYRELILRLQDNLSIMDSLGTEEPEAYIPILQSFAEVLGVDLSAEFMMTLKDEEEFPLQALIWQIHYLVENLFEFSSDFPTDDDEAIWLEFFDLIDQKGTQDTMRGITLDYNKINNQLALQLEEFFDRSDEL